MDGRRHHNLKEVQREETVRKALYKLSLKILIARKSGMGTFIHPKEDVGRKAVKILLDMLDGKDGRTYVFKPEFVMRSSVSNPGG